MERTILKFNKNMFNEIYEKRENNNMEKIRNSMFHREIDVKIREVKY